MMDAAKQIWGAGFSCLMVVLVASCATGGAKSTTTAGGEDAAVAAQIAGMQIVDCLLPGQVRRLGNTTYVTQRRPISTTAEDCNIRGGEYVAYDRANYKTALKVWLPAAKAGDAEAQVNVGQIFEKGLGTEPNYEAAVLWYEKAAAQGNERGLFNLGTMYEQGRGVEKNRLKALNLYRQAWGMPQDSVIFQETARAQRAELAAQLDTKLAEKDAQLRALQQQIEALKQQLQASSEAKAEASGANSAMAGQIQALQGIVDALSASRAELKQELAALPEPVAPAEPAFSPDDAARMQAQIEALEAKLAAATDVASASSSDRQAMAEQVASLRASRAELQQELAALPEPGVVADRAAQMQAKVEALEVKLAAATEAASASSSDQQAMAEQVASLRASRAELQQELAALPEPSVSADRAAQMQAQIGALETKLAAATDVASASSSDRQAMAEQVASLRARVAELKASREQVQRQQLASAAEAQPPVQTPPAREQPSVENPAMRAPESDPEVAAKVTAVASQDEPPEIHANGLDFGQYYALVIGNRNYLQVDDLYTSVNDAKAVAEVLKSHYGFHVNLLIDADRLTMMKTINELHGKLGENDNLLVYYAGHGTLVNVGQREVGYWLPTNANPPPDNSFWVPDSFITGHLGRLNAKRVLVIADSCYGGLLSSAPGMLMFGDVEASKKYLQYKLPRRSRLLLTSGGEQPVIDSVGDNHSVFAAKLLEVLRSNKGIMSVPELYAKVDTMVRKTVAAMDMKQNPQLQTIKGAGHEVGGFFFVPTTAADKTVASR